MPSQRNIKSESSKVLTSEPTTLRADIIPLSEDYMKPATKNVIQGIEGILGYTELHPEMVFKIETIDKKLKSFETRIKEYDTIIEGVRGFNMDDVKKLIEMSK